MRSLLGVLLLVLAVAAACGGPAAPPRATPYSDRSASPTVVQEDEVSLEVPELI